MKILIVEDEGIMYNRLRENFKEESEIKEVLTAFQVSSAMDRIDEDKPDFILLDLHIPGSGLSKEDIKDSLGGILHGWCWLKNYVLKQDDSWRKRVIIYSAHAKKFVSHVGKEEYRDIEIFSKGKDKIEDVVECLIQKVKKLGAKDENKIYDK